MGAATQEKMLKALGKVRFSAERVWAVLAKGGIHSRRTLEDRKDVGSGAFETRRPIIHQTSSLQLQAGRIHFTLQ